MPTLGNLTKKFNGEKCLSISLTEKKKGERRKKNGLKIYRIQTVPKVCVGHAVEIAVERSLNLRH